MTRIEIPITAYSVQSVQPGRKFGQLGRPPLLAGSSEIYFRAALSKIPAGATVVSAVGRFYSRTDETGSRTLNVQPTTTHVGSNITYSKKPASAGTTATLTKASPGANTAWDFDLKTGVQQVVSGTRVDYGWRLLEAAATPNIMRMYGTTAAIRKPVLIVEYTTLPLAPDNLHPAGGSVAVAKPTLTFDADDRIIGLQVQVDAAMNATTPGFDSGTVAAAGGMLDLNDTAYAGLAAGATTYWRARQQTGSGWSPWSDWVAMTRLAKPTLTLLNPPAGNIDDGTPPYQWSLVGTQAAWQARLLNASGDVLADSGFTPGTDTDWTPPRGLKRDGEHGVVELLVWDDKDRVATPGDPEYVMVTQEVTYVLDPTVDALSSLTASQSEGTPDVVLVGRRTEIPDQVVVFRDGVQLGVWDGVDVFVGPMMTFVDPNPPMGRPVTYRVAPRVNGKTSKGGPQATIVPFAEGIWIESVETGERALLHTDEGVPEQDQPETAVVHTPLNSVDGQAQVVRRRLARYRPQGTVKGVVTDPDSTSAAIPSALVSEALLREWAEDGDAGDLYWLTFSGYTGSVIIGDVTFSERDNPQQRETRLVDVTFNFWGQV